MALVLVWAALVMIRLRPAEPADEWIAWQLRLEIQPELTREWHLEWWNNAIEHRFIACDGSAQIGIIRITPQGERGEVHILVASSARGQGFGPEILEAVMPHAAALGMKGLYARVALENEASQRAFLDAGYRPTRFEVKL